MSCAQTAEAIDLLFELWTLVGRRKRKFNRTDQMVPVCSISIVFARWRQSTQRHSAVSCAKMAELIDLLFGLLTRVSRMKHKFNHICQVAPMCPHGRAHWCHLANTTEPSVCCGSAVLCRITLTTC